MKWLSRTAQGFLAPLAAAVGGVASQEVLKAVTGKFSPLQQWVRLSLVLDLSFDSDVMYVWLCVLLCDQNRLNNFYNGGRLGGRLRLNLGKNIMVFCVQ